MKSEVKKRARMTDAEIAVLPAQALKHVQSVSYAVSLRWVFYRLIQDGVYSKKGDYVRFKLQASKWRHQQIDGWKPDTLTDETREAIYRGTGDAWAIDEIIGYVSNSFPSFLKEGHFKYQGSYVELWFEARAMAGQFQQYTNDIVLRPFGGFTSIPFKYQMAKDLENMAARFQKPIKILYFGDRDKAGDTIRWSSVDGPKGLRKWCAVDFDIIPCGLTSEQVEMFRARGQQIPENPDKPGEYQWEALTDAQAREIIAEAVSQYVDQKIISRLEKEAEKKAEEYRGRLFDAFEDELNWR